MKRFFSKNKPPERTVPRLPIPDGIMPIEQACDTIGNAVRSIIMSMPPEANQGLIEMALKPSNVADPVAHVVIAIGPQIGAQLQAAVQVISELKESDADTIAVHEARGKLNF